MRAAQPAKILRLYLTLALIEGIGAILWLLALPTAPGTGILERLSPGRLAAMAPGLLLLAIIGTVLAALRRKPSRAELWSAWLVKPLLYWVLIALCWLFLLFGLYFLAIGLRTTDQFIIAYFQRLLPSVAWGMLLALQSLLAMRILRHGFDLTAFRPYRTNFIAFLVAGAALAALAVFIILTHSGLQPDRYGWGVPGVPLLASQVWLALAVCLGVVALASLAGTLWAKNRLPAAPLNPRFFDLALCLLIWLAAVWHWGSQPLKPNYFAPLPTPPNQEFYPYSDAAGYDLSAQKLLVGAGFERDVPRPLYSAFLALAQGVSGSGYSNAIAWQIPLLALIPVLLYLLGGAIHHRLSGLLVALLYLLREGNSLALSGAIDLSNAKLLMSDLPATLGVVMFSLLLIQWLKKPASRRIYPFLAGGVLGLTMLVRTQVFVLLPVAIVYFLLPFLCHCDERSLRRSNLSRWLKASLLLTAGVLVALAPWLWRNWQLTGKITLTETSNVQAGLLGRRYTLNDGFGYEPRLPNESGDEYLSRMAGNAARFAVQHPVETIAFVNAHFWRNQVATLLTLPAYYPLLTDLKISSYSLDYWRAKPEAFWDSCCSLDAYIETLPYWVRGWDGHLLAISFLPLVTSLLLLSVGIGSAWGRARFAGLLPLAIAAGYSLGNAFVRNSGWRFNLPVDWIGMLFFAIGLVQIGFWLATYFSNRLVPAAWPGAAGSLDTLSETQKRFPWGKTAIAAAGFILLVGAIPLAERLIPDRYPAQALEIALANLESRLATAPPDSSLDPTTLQRFLDDSGGQAVLGRALYPRWYAASDGLSLDTWSSYDVRAYPRLGFYLVGNESRPVVLPAQASPSYFPNAADVLILGCPREDLFEGYLIAFQDQNIILSSPLNEWNCGQQD